MTSSAHLEEIWAEFIRTHSQAQRRLLIEAYVPLVKVTVDRLGIPARSLLEADDLIGYGMLGLINAIDRYDPTRGISFEAFASARIRGAVIDQLRALNWFSRSAMQRIKQVEQTMAELERRLGRPARDEEMAAALGVSLRRYRRMLQEVGTVILSLDSPSIRPRAMATITHSAKPWRTRPPPNQPAPSSAASCYKPSARLSSTSLAVSASCSLSTTSRASA